MPSATPKGFPTVLHRDTVQPSSSGKEVDALRVMHICMLVFMFTYENKGSMDCMCFIGTLPLTAGLRSNFCFYILTII